MPEDDPGAGNRFDSLLGNYGVLYCATALSGCYTEVLARFRPSPRLRSVVADEWDERGWMRIGSLPASWRERTRVVRLAVDASSPPFLDVENADTRAYLERKLGPGLAYLGVDHLDVPVIRREDRRVTRMISQWAWGATDDDGVPMFSGIRYLSKLDTDEECWAIFDDVGLRTLSERPVDPDHPELRRVLDRYGLILH